MVTNKQIARSFNLLGKLMELHEENGFKIRSYYSAYNALRRIETPFAEMDDASLLTIPGIGQTIVDKIRELSMNGSLKALEKLKSVTPQGVQDMLGIRGLGPKKVAIIWKEMDVTSISELHLACSENRLVKFKGFGLKTQEEIKQNLEYFMASQGQYHYGHIIDIALHALEAITSAYPSEQNALVGELARMMPTVSGIFIATTAPILDFEKIGITLNEEGLPTYREFPITITCINPNRWGNALFEDNSSEDFKSAIGYLSSGDYVDENALFTSLNASFVPSEYRETADAAVQALKGSVPILVQFSDIKGVVHNHSTYSDGLHSLEEMTKSCIDRGYDYFVISDHSKTAAYAGGLSVERVLMQWAEIDKLNEKFPNFKIFKGIESDILQDGSLDYSDDVLAGFDVVIASIHGQMNMDEVTATSRLIKAIENPFTKILGHPTGRLLLGRPGYPINHIKVIDAASANGVCIELNANPQRLDMDWTWIAYAMKKNVLISINPDAHSKDQIDYIKYGVAAARKGGLTKEMCLNSRNLVQFHEWLNKK